MEADYLTSLNPKQKEFATTLDGYVLALAGAGTGKTRAITARVAYMLEQGISPKEILLLTFTNKAAKEMKDRIIRQTGVEGLGITACTFHSFCAIFLRYNAELVGYQKDFTILDSTDAADAVGIAKQEFINEQKTKGQNYNLKDFPATKQIRQVYESAVNNCASQEEVIMLLNLDAYFDEILTILQKYKEYKRARGFMDYEDLLYFTEKLLMSDEFLRKKYDERYRYISCDEYQDTNTIQNHILSLLSRDYPNLAVVGDDNQSIYAFRYANIANILSFETRHPDCKTIVLDTNYRSTQEILDFVNAMMCYATEGKEKWLTGLSHGKKPQIIVTDDSYEEADFIIRKIQEQTCPRKEIAIICRSASQSYVLESKLNAYGIPYDKFGGIKFMEKPTVKDILAFLRISVNEKDELAWFRLLQLYPGIGKTYAQRIANLILEQDFEAVAKKYGKRQFYPYVEELKNTMKELKSLSLNAALKYLLQSYYPSVKERQIDVSDRKESEKSESYHALKQNLQDAEMLLPMAEKYKSANRFLNDLTLDATVEKEKDADRLNITTIHSAKGLEYDVVFLMDCIEGITPRCEEGDKEDPEELRCMYVAATRAKKELYLMIPKYYSMRGLRGYLSHFINKDDILEKTETNVSQRELDLLVDQPVFW